MRWFLALMGLIWLAPPLAAQTGFQSVRYEFAVSRGIESPVDVAVTPTGDVAVLDGKAMRVMVFSRDGSLRLGFGDKKQMPKPVALAVAPNGSFAVADDRLKKVLLYSPEGKLSGAFGSSGTGSGQFKKLIDIAYDHFGFIYTSDAGNSRVSRFTPKGVLLASRPLGDLVAGVLSVDRQGRITMLGGSGPGVYRFTMQPGSRMGALRFQDKPSSAGGIYVDSRGDLYLTRYSKHRVVKYDANGGLIASFGSRGKGPGAFSGPTRLAGNDRDEVFVVDTKNRRIQVFNLEDADGEALPIATQGPASARVSSSEQLNDGVTDLTLVASGDQLRLFGASGRVLRKGLETSVLGASGRGAGEFRGPQGVDLLADGRLVVADTGNHRVQLVATGRAATVIGERGKDPGFFSAPEDVAVNSQGMIYVADTGNSRVQIFTDQGIFMHEFGRAGKVKKDARVPLDLFVAPSALVIDANDRVHVLDRGLGRVVTFDPRGQSMGVLDGFTQPADIAVDAQGNLFVADNGCNCVKVFGEDGHLVLRFGGAGEGPGQLHAMSALAVHGGRVLVATGGAKTSIPFALKSKATANILSFDIDLQGSHFAERLSLTHSYFVPIDASPDRRRQYRDLALGEASRQLAAKAGLATDRVRRELQIDSERERDGGEMVLRVSIAAPSEGAPGPTNNVTPAQEPVAEEAEVELAF